MAVFGERPSPAQVLGLALAVASLIVLSLTTSAPEAARPARFSPVLIPLFFITGCSGVAMKAFQEYGPPAELMSFNAVLFAAATLSTLLAMGWQRMTVGARAAKVQAPPPPASSPGRHGAAALVVGVLMGASNAAQLIFLMAALATEPAILVFPISSALSLVANAIASIYFWREWVRPAAWLGLGLALLASVLLNLRPA